MTESTKNYKIKKGDCLSLLADRFHVDVNDLYKLNVDQIKDLDVIYAGNEIRIPGETPSNPLDYQLVTKLPEIPEKSANSKDLCDSPKYADILYVPSSPKTGKKAYYAITQLAKSTIKKEQSNLFNAIDTDDNSKTLKQLKELGIFSSFYTSPHDMFLNNKDSERYEFLVLALKTLESDAYKGKENFIQKLADQELEKGFQQTFDIFLEELQYKSLDRKSTLDENQLKAKELIKTTLERSLTENIKSFENKAIDKAKMKKSDDGSFYVYDSKAKHYTSEIEKEIEHTIKIVKRRLNYYSNDKLAFLSHERSRGLIKDFTDLISVSDARIEYYMNDLNYINKHGFLLPEQCLTIDELEGNKEENQGPKEFRENYSNWRESDDYKKGLPIDISNADNLIDELFKDVNQDFQKIGKRDIAGKIKVTEEKALDTMLKETGAKLWSYYPCLALIKIIDATLEQWNSDVSNLLGKNNHGKSYSKIPLPKIFSGMLWIKKLALTRFERLKSLAEKRANTGKNVQYIKPDILKSIKTFKVVWDNEEYFAKKKQEKAIRPGNDYCRVVECVLMSEGKLGWVRGPSWYLPETKEDLKQAKGHLKDITDSIVVISETQNKKLPPEKNPFRNLDQALKSINIGLSNKNKQSLLPQTLNDKFILNPENLCDDKEVIESKFWSSDYHWEIGYAPSDIKSEYVTDASVQFFRFTVNHKEDINDPLVNYTGITANRYGEYDGQFKMSFELFSGKMRTEAWFPLNKYKKPGDKLKGHETFLYYNTREDSKPQPYLVGEFFCHLCLDVYATAGASIALSENIKIGPSDGKDGNIGVRGSAYTTNDYIPTDRHSIYQRKTENNTAVAAVQHGSIDVQGSVDMFAGVEVGGNFVGEVYWRPPKQSFNGYTVHDDKMRIGQISTKYTVNYGVGLGGEIRLTLHNGTLYWIVAARWVSGVGASGKYAIALNYLNIDRLFDHILNVFYENGFVNISAIDNHTNDYINNNDIAIRTMNNLFTSALFYGLNVGEVLLLPAKMWEDYNYDSLKEDYGNVLAKNIIDKDSQKETQLWVQKLPPEVLANLFSCLCDIRNLDYISKDNAQILMQKLSATDKVIQWIFKKPDANEINARQQYQTTLSLLGGKGKISNITYEKWFNIFEGWLYIYRLIELIEKTRSDIDKRVYEVKNRRSINYYKDILEEFDLFDIESFKSSIYFNHNELSKNLNLYKKKSNLQVIEFIVGQYDLDYMINYNETIVIKNEHKNDDFDIKKDRDFLLNKVSKEHWIKKRKWWDI
ncbi:LysM peptidoglycan-binding domain-containing protein [Vibrio palustris]|uniref:LysM domain protein n=1 Tax=Vibrio palustris TaxID=1918946 RepID=A0A1R4B632_9VIBR|nr:LysM domain-containing protein [Vibrio palustris]SJL84377.1 LysM domain protein [Vibrio palustris]